MANLNLQDEKVRQQVLKDIKSEDNRARKREHQKRFDVFRERQDRYILERLEREFDADTVNEMRKIFSINLTKRIIDEKSSIYNTSPDRTFARLSDAKLTDKEESQLMALYEENKVNAAMRKANQCFNLHDQCATIVVPDMRGCIKTRTIAPMHYDVIPQFDDQEKAYAYILNVWDFDLHKSAKGESSEPTQLNRYRQSDRINQDIADNDDRKAHFDRFVVWTDEEHFTMDGNGNIIGEAVPNPIGRLPFVDHAEEKDFQFFVRNGTSVVDFALDFGLLISDLANIVRLQGYSQAVISSEKKPVVMRVGVNRVLHLPLNPQKPEMKPTFEFVSPQPDLAGSLEFMETTLRLFLSSKGIDPSTISGKGEARSFSSGIERLLSMLDKFEATKSDLDLFRNSEKEIFELLVAWSNEFQNVSGPGELKPQLRQANIPDDIFMDVNFNEPTAVQTKEEKENSIRGLMDDMLMSRKEAIMDLRGVSEEKAIQVMKEIDKEAFEFGKTNKGTVQDGIGERETEIEAEPERDSRD